MTMKTKIVFAIFSFMLLGLIVCEQANAQAASTKRAGIKGGLNVSNLYIDDVTDENARPGINIGLFGELVSTEGFGLQTELLYSTKGSKIVYDTPANQEIQYNLNYLELPVLAVFKLGAVDLHAGAYGGYLLGANISYDGELADGTDEIDKDNLKSWDYGLVGGVGVNFGAMQVGARYNYGLVKLSNSDAADFLIGDSKNSCAQLYIAINLNSRK